jgi:thiamine-monophosphate kinase
VQLSGWVERDTALRRSGGRPGDLLVVTGSLGDSAAGLAIASGNLRAEAPPDGKGASATASSRGELRRRFEYPEPRVEFGRLARGIATAAMDLSDGIAGDLPKLAMASGVAARVAVDRLPLSPALRSCVPEGKARLWALSGGDDYELLLSVPSGRLADLLAAAEQCQLKLSQIGELCAGSGVTWSMDGRPLEVHPAGYEHFR